MSKSEDDAIKEFEKYLENYSEEKRLEHEKTAEEIVLKSIGENLEEAEKLSLSNEFHKECWIKESDPEIRRIHEEVIKRNSKIMLEFSVGKVPETESYLVDYLLEKRVLEFLTQDDTLDHEDTE
jgi:hypothetical protein